LLPQRSARVRRQPLELRDGGAEIDGVVDGGADRIPVVVQESQHEERRRHDAQLAAMIDDQPLLILRDRAAADLLERLGRHRFDAEADGAQADGMQPIEHRRIESIEPGLALERELEASRLDGVGDLERSLAELCDSGSRKMMYGRG